MDCPQVLKPFPVSRYISFNDFRFYYGYGNTPAEDLLESLVGTEFPSVLLLGCGDIRSCFYTLWKNFDGAHKGGFSGANFVLVDHSAAILARNILFLYLCLQKPTEVSAVRKWVAAIWAVWFCHELSQDHESVLNEALSKLRNWSSSLQTWSESKENPLRRIVKFETEDTLREVALMWKHWHEESTEKPGVDAMKVARKSMQKMFGTDDAKEVARAKLTPLQFFLPKDKKRMMEESDSYVESGTVFAESVLGLSLPSEQTVVNYTLYERMDWAYTMEPPNTPWTCFPAPLYTISKAEMERTGVSKAILDQIVVTDVSFESSPLLANCMQLFSLWLISSSTTLANASGKLNPPIVFTCVFSDALEFCQTQTAKAKFDFIHASNLIDHVSPPNLVLVALPLLESSGYLHTGTMLYKDLAPNTHLFLEKCFGFKPHLLPLVCGVRCIDHEDKYSSPLSIQLKSSYIKSCTESNPLFWRKVTAPSLKILSLEKGSTVLNALCNSVCTAVLSFFHNTRTCKHGIYALAPLCAGSAMMILQSFVDQIDGSLKPLPCSFWEPLCSLLKNDGRLKPHLVSLQAQALLHSLHLHLILSELECPICQGKPVTCFLSQFTVNLNLPLCADKNLQYCPRCVMVYIHKQEVLKDRRDGDVHIVDSIGRNIDSSSNMLSLNFFAPSAFAEDGYYMSVEISRGRSRNTVLVEFVPINTLPKGKLIDFRAPKTTYNVSGTNSSLPSTLSTLGVIDQHIGTGDEFDTSISLSNTAVAALAETSLSSKQISDSQLEVLCGKHSLKIQYPYSVDHNSAEIQHQTPCRIHVKVTRRPRFFHEEKPYYIVDPDNRIVLMPSTTQLESNLHVEEDHSTASSVKNAIDTIIFNSPEVINFPIHTEVLKGVIIVQGRVLDLHKQTCAVDINYCLCDEISLDGTAAMQNIRMNEEEFDLLAKTLAYFAKCTKPSSGKMLLAAAAVKSDNDFKRAVVYPLHHAECSRIMTWETVQEFCWDDQGTITMQKNYMNEEESGVRTAFGDDVSAEATRFFDLHQEKRRRLSEPS